MADAGQRPAASAAELLAAVADSGILCLAMMLRFLKLPADPAQIRHDHAPDGQPLDNIALVRAAKSLGVKARAVKVTPRRLEKAALPAIAEAKDGSYFVLARVGQGQALIHRPGLSDVVSAILRQDIALLALDELAESASGSYRYLHPAGVKPPVSPLITRWFTRPA